MLPYQTPGISNQALVFMRDVKMFASRTDMLVKGVIFDNTPAEFFLGGLSDPPFKSLSISIHVFGDYAAHFPVHGRKLHFQLIL